MKLNLRVLIVEAGFKSQAEFAREIGVTKQTVNKWIKENKIPTNRFGDIVDLVYIAHKETGRYTKEIEELNNLKGWF